MHMEGGALPIAALSNARVRRRPDLPPQQPPLSKSTPSTTAKPRGIRADQSWTVGERIEHSQFGFGQITHVFGSGQKVTLAVKFPGLGQQKILDPRLAPIEKV
ncbi:MAG: hypothetical protein HC924_07865 [Synechococcaceae cyanobacterium SM2_3_2]|nr:hypothetical protein [Synechococcaceae cyanobacterium SM2_3_2]